MMFQSVWVLYGLGFLPGVIALGFFFLMAWTGRELRNVLTETAQSKDHYEKAKARHTELKKDVMNEEKEENRSFLIYGLAKGLGEALSWGDMAPKLTSGIQKVFNAHEFLLYSIDGNQRWDLLHRRGGWAKEPPFVGDLPHQPQLLRPPHTEEVLPVLFVPIFSNARSGSQMNGALFMKVHPEKHEDDLVIAGEEFGEELGMALNKAILFSQMELNSRIDGLTGLLRRQAFMERLTEEVKKAKAFQTPYCILMVDIDLFKSVNDSHGHGAGDIVLSRVGQIIKESFYETDVVGRYGGEEFIVLLPRAEFDGVLRKAESLRRRIEADTISCGFTQLHITVSIGAAHYPSHGTSADDIIARADRALYHAKESGRNRVIGA